VVFFGIAYFAFADGLSLWWLGIPIVSCLIGAMVTGLIDVFTDSGNDEE